MKLRLRPTPVKSVSTIVLFLVAGLYAFQHKVAVAGPVCQILCNPLHGTESLPPCPPCAYGSTTYVFDHFLVGLAILIPITFYFAYSAIQARKLH